MSTPSVLAGSESGLTEGFTRVGSFPGDVTFGVTVWLRRRRKLDLALLTGDAGIEIFDRTTFTDLFGAAQADLDMVKSFAAANGLLITASDLAMRCVELHGNATCYSAAFAVRLGRYHGPGGVARLHEGGIQLPPELAPIVLAVIGFDDLRVVQSCIRPGRTLLSCGTAFRPDQLATAYRLPPGDGAGQAIGLIGFAPEAPLADLIAFCRLLGISQPKLRVIAVATDTLATDVSSVADRDALAAMLELLAALAPRAEFVLRHTAPTERGCIDALAQAVHGANPALHVLCLGWAGPEEGWSRQAALTINDILADAAALGITVCAATGDHGAAFALGSDYAAVSLPASSPFALACGGTAPLSSADGVPSEAVWNDFGPSSLPSLGSIGRGAGGGGVSTLFAVPSWQQSHLPPLSVRTAKPGRGVPDVAAVAAPFPGVVCVLDGLAVACGGTALSAALWAALVARMNQKIGKPLGFLTPHLYALPRAATFNEVTLGGTETNGLIGGYFARLGWDACTGLGTPRGDAILRGLAYFADAGPGPRVCGHFALNWLALPGLAHDVAAGSDGTLWALGLATMDGLRPLYRSSAVGWIAIPGVAATALAVARDGTPWLADAAGVIRTWDGATWQLHPGRACSLAFAGDGMLWIVAHTPGGQDGDVLRWNGAAFVPAGATARQVRGTRYGEPLLLTGAGAGLHYYGKDWIQIAQNAVDIAGDADGQIWTTSRPGGRIWRYQGLDASWLEVSDAVAERLVPLHDGGLLAIQLDGRIFVGREAAPDQDAS